MTHLFEIGHTDYPDLLKRIHVSGIKAVSPENWSRLQSTCKLMHQPPFAMLKVHKKIDDVKQQIAQSQSPFFLKVLHREILHWGRLIHSAYQKWQQKQIDCLNDPLWWSHCFSKVKSFSSSQQEKAHAVLKKLQHRWFLEGHYAHYSTLDLLHVYQSVMPVFSEWLHYAKSECEKQGAHLSPYLLNRYQQSLVWFEEALSTEKRRLRTCLQGRLVVSLNAGNGSWDNLLGAIQAELQAIDVLPKQPKLTTALAHGHLTPEAFVAIRQIIETDGQDAEKKAFYGLAYHRDFERISHDVQPPYRVDAQGNSYFIPPCLNTAIPLKPSIYRWLPTFLQPFFWDEHVYSTFFQHPDCQFLLAQEVAFLHATMDLTTVTLDNLLHHPAWQQNHMCLTHIAAERERTETWLRDRPVTAFLFPSTITLLENYQQSLRERAQRWFTKQLMLLNQVIAAKENVLFEVSERVTVEKILEELENIQKAWSLTGDISTELLQIRLNYHERVIQDPMNPNEQKLALPYQFRESIRQAIEIFETTQTISLPQVEAFKKQLNVSSAKYDSVALRFAVVNIIKAGTLPNALNIALQTLLDQPEFSESVLNQEENKALGELKKRLPERLPTLVKNPLAIFDENPLHSDLPTFTQHWAAVKKTLVPLTDPNILSWQGKFAEYSSRFLKGIQNLSDWEDFVVHRTQITAVLDLLIEMSSTHFIALHPSLMALSTREKNLSAEEWTLFKDIYLATPIQSLTTCLQTENADTDAKRIDLDAVSYQSQKELAFLPSNVSQKPRVLQNDSPDSLPTTTL